MKRVVFGVFCTKKMIKIYIKWLYCTSFLRNYAPRSGPKSMRTVTASLFLCNNDDFIIRFLKMYTKTCQF